MSDNFLSRWSRRKLEAQEKEKAAELVLPEPPDLPVVQAQQVEEVPANQPEPILPTEADLAAVEHGGDIKAFMIDKVSTELKNKAFKALFSRPEFNVMDGLDIYIDDYNKFTPLTQEDIGKMTLSKQLLSRPDLELPKINEVMSKAQEVVEDLKPKVESLTVVDKADELPIVSDSPVELNEPPRVIPNDLQVIESEVLSSKNPTLPAARESS